ncbi:MAG: nitrous oxide reductase accessory protein NosL [Campylobacterota bacterium]
MKLNRLVKIALIGLIITSSLIVANADKMMKMFQSVNPNEATLVQTNKSKKFCPICGMTLPMFYKTNHSAIHEEAAKQYCSIHCVVEDKEINKSNLKSIKVVDVSSLKFIPANSAIYVVGSKKKGTMSTVSKYAFANKSDAEKFAKANGGKLMSYSEAYTEAKKDFPKDSMMISKKQAKAAGMGEKMYNKMCKKTDKKFSSTAEAKAYINENRLCGDIKGKKLQAIGIYLGKR